MQCGGNFENDIYFPRLKSFEVHDLNDYMKASDCKNSKDIQKQRINNIEAVILLKPTLEAISTRAPIQFQ